MVASQNIKTPSMSVPFLNTAIAHKKSSRLKKQLTKVTLHQVLEDMHVYESYQIATQWDQYRVYRVRLNFLPHEEYKDELYTNPSAVLEYVEKLFLKKLLEIIKKKHKELMKMR